MASMLKNGKNPMDNLCANGCSCCNTKEERRKVKKSLKAKEKRKWKRNEQLDN